MKYDSKRKNACPFSVQIFSNWAQGSGHCGMVTLEDQRQENGLLSYRTADSQRSVMFLTGVLLFFAVHLMASSAGSKSLVQLHQN